jgi:hypothetical protein
MLGRTAYLFTCPSIAHLIQATRRSWTADERRRAMEGGAFVEMEALACHT